MIGLYFVLAVCIWASYVSFQRVKEANDVVYKYEPQVNFLRMLFIRKLVHVGVEKFFTVFFTIMAIAIIFIGLAK